MIWHYLHTWFCYTNKTLCICPTITCSAAHVTIFRSAAANIYKNDQSESTMEIINSRNAINFFRKSNILAASPGWRSETAIQLVWFTVLELLNVILTCSQQIDMLLLSKAKMLLDDMFLCVNQLIKNCEKETCWDLNLSIWRDCAFATYANPPPLFFWEIYLDLGS